jgi:hypothetical protein
VSRVFPVFAVVFAVVYTVTYALAVWKNYALFTYHPAIYEFGFGVQKAKDGPAMYWYGWMATSAIAAAIAGGMASLLPAAAQRRLWPGLAWLVPLGAMLFFAWLLRGYFFR